MFVAGIVIRPFYLLWSPIDSDNRTPVTLLCRQVIFAFVRQQKDTHIHTVRKLCLTKLLPKPVPLARDTVPWNLYR